MTKYTVKELLNTSFTNKSKTILGGTLRTGLYIFGAKSKTGKSMICTELVGALAQGYPFLNLDNPTYKSLYFDNDNYDYEGKDRLSALTVNETDDVIMYYDEDASSFQSIKRIISNISNIEEYGLVIVDSLANISEFILTDTTDYKSMYSLIIDFRDYIVSKNLICILLHHTKKGSTSGADALLGSTALQGAASGTIILNVEDEYSTEGSLDFILRNRKLSIPIIKDYLDISWYRCEEGVYKETIDSNLKEIIDMVVKSNDHIITGRAQEICNNRRITLNPAGLVKFLNKNKTILNQNFIYFSTKHQKDGNVITLEYLKENEVK